jgi:AcrR family transcriptional regulator
MGTSLKMTDRSVIIYSMAKIAASEREDFYESRRAELAEAALRLWAENGFDSTSVASIAEAAGISKGTFYLYFDSKQALLEDVLRRYTLLPSIQTLVEGMANSSFEDAVHTFVRVAWRHLSEHRDLVLLALRELPSHLEQAQQAIERVLVPGNRLLARYLEERLGSQRAGEISLVVAGRGLVGMLVMLFLTQEILGASRFLPVAEADITSTIAQVFLHGVLGANEGTQC